MRACIPPLPCRDEAGQPEYKPEPDVLQALYGASRAIAPAPSRQQGASSPREFLAVSDPASACGAHSGFVLRWVLTTVGGTPVQMRARVTGVPHD